MITTVIVHNKFAGQHNNSHKNILPSTVMVAEAMDSLLLATVHVYVPGLLPVTVRVCVCVLCSLWVI